MSTGAVMAAVCDQEVAGSTMESSADGLALGVVSL